MASLVLEFFKLLSASNLYKFDSSNLLAEVESI